jgi:cyclic beta-1,2-glucan synthetase
LDQPDKAYDLFAMINPINHARDQDTALAYRAEPYVVAADIYSHGSYRGRGGWTWYTGAAGWAYRAGLEAILGIKRRGHIIRVLPRIPSSWQECRVTLRHDGKSVTLAYARTPDAAPNNDGVEFDLRQYADGDTIHVSLPAKLP